MCKVQSIPVLSPDSQPAETCLTKVRIKPHPALAHFYSSLTGNAL